MIDQQLMATVKHVIWEEGVAFPYEKTILPVSLRYYLLTSYSDQTPYYGIGIEKETEKNGIIYLEQKMIYDVFVNKTDCQNFLNKLIHNIVFPIALSDIIIDEIA